MMSSAPPPVDLVRNTLELINGITDPAKVKATLQVFANEQAALDKRASTLNDARQKVTAREKAADARDAEQEAKDKALADREAKVAKLEQSVADKAEAHLGETRAAVADHMQRMTAADDRDKQNKINAAKNAADFAKLAKEWLALNAARTGLEAREKVHQEDIEAFAVQKALIAKAVQGL